ncbi:MAG: hypothetical protein ACSHXF_11020 [Aquaticitalea sp.]
MHTYRKNGYKKSMNGAATPKTEKPNLLDASLKDLPWDDMTDTSWDDLEGDPSNGKAAPTIESEVEKRKQARYEETGFAINLKHFFDVKQAAIGLGTAYVSPNPLFALEHLEVVYTAASEAILKVVSKLTLYQQAIDLQTAAFAGLKKASTRAKAIFSICGVPPEVVIRIDNINALIQGVRIIKIKASDLNEDNVSASHQSRAQQIVHVDSLIELLSLYPEYVAPADLTVAAFTARRNAMDTTLKNVMDHDTTLKLTRMERNEIMETPGTGLVDIAYGVKNVFKGIFGARSPQYRLVSGIKFTRMKGYEKL